MTRTPASRKQVRCAIYTRKSTEEGLEQAFNSLVAQRESCAAYVASQRHEGWTALPDRYDDGGFSGGSIERPALQALLCDVQAGKIDVVVVYKVDRLTRALADFARVVSIFDAAGVSFVLGQHAPGDPGSLGVLEARLELRSRPFSPSRLPSRPGSPIRTVYEQKAAAERLREVINGMAQRLAEAHEVLPPPAPVPGRVRTRAGWRTKSVLIHHSEAGGAGALHMSPVSVIAAS